MPEPIIISGDEAKLKSPADLFAQLASSLQGLSGAEATARLAQYGPNALEEERPMPSIGNPASGAFFVCKPGEKSQARFARPEFVLILKQRNHPEDGRWMDLPSKPFPAAVCPDHHAADFLGGLVHRLERHAAGGGGLVAGKLLSPILIILQALRCLRSAFDFSKR